MINQVRNSHFLKILWTFMGMYLLNISVDTPDLQSNELPEDLSFNNQESLVELIIEKVLGFEEALKEYDDPDSEEFSLKKNLEITLTNPKSDNFTS